MEFSSIAASLSSQKPQQLRSSTPSSASFPVVHEFSRFNFLRTSGRQLCRASFAMSLALDPTSSNSVTTKRGPTDRPIRDLMGLARVEAQSIMQFLPRVELIRFSRCSRTLLEDGDTDVAWRTQPIFDFQLSPTTSEGLISMDPAINRAHRTSSMLMRHQPAFGVHIEPDESIGSDLPFILAIFEAIPRITRMILGDGNDYPPDEWIKILESSNLDHLTECHLECQIYVLSIAKILDILQRMPLRVLTLPYTIFDSVTRLQTFPCLSVLSITDSELLNEEGTVASSITKCTGLTKLHISSFEWRSDEQFYRIFSSPHLSQLRELSIHRWMLWEGDSLTDHLNHDRLNYLCAAWMAMNQLERLTLKEITDIHSVLETLASCCHQREVDAKYARQKEINQGNDQNPTVTTNQLQPTGPKSTHPKPMSTNSSSSDVTMPTTLRYLRCFITHYADVPCIPTPHDLRHLLEETTTLRIELSMVLYGGTDEELNQYQLLVTDYPTRFHTCQPEEITRRYSNEWLGR